MVLRKNRLVIQLSDDEDQFEAPHAKPIGGLFSIFKPKSKTTRNFQDDDDVFSSKASSANKADALTKKFKKLVIDRVEVPANKIKDLDAYTYFAQTSWSPRKNTWKSQNSIPQDDYSKSPKLVLSGKSRDRKMKTPPTPSDEDDEFYSADAMSRPSASASVDTEDEEETEEEEEEEEEKKKMMKKRQHPFFSKQHAPAENAVSRTTFDNILNSNLPPISSIPAIFEDLVSRTPRLVDFAQHIAGRKLRVATMCSGTESPLLALGLITGSLEKQTGQKLVVDHVFSCEIEPFKQSYIERNFKPPILFRDICELGNEKATTAYGSMQTVPGDVDILIAGTSCVDYSSLNNKQQSIDADGESGRTFRGMMAWVDKNRPTVIILENVCGAPWNRVKSDFESRGYSADFQRFDTKSYYLPHTRTRVYLVAINKKKSHLPMAWREMVVSLRRPASTTLEAFMLESDDPRIHQARQNLVKGKDGDERRAGRTDWTKCTFRHEKARLDEQLGRSRPLTKWDESGGSELPDFAWSDWGSAQVERVLDLMDISVLRSAKNGIDPAYKTQLWNLSQNVDRNTSSTKPGICPCLTPTMVPYITNRGGPMVGLESLSMQGLPIEQLLLTHESEAQLSDLAGNAMTTTVVGSAIISALIVAKDLFKKGPGGVVEEEKVEDVSKRIGGFDNITGRPLDLATTEGVSLEGLLDSAQRSSRYCECEGRVGMTSDKMFVCLDCGNTSCEKCVRHPVHRYIDLDTSNRITPEDFEKLLKSVIPMRVHVGGLDLEVLEQLKAIGDLEIPDKTWSTWTKAIVPALGVEYRFRSLKRSEIWSITYEAENARLELLLDPKQPEWRIFALPLESEPANGQVRKLLTLPIARMQLKDTPLDGSWDVCLPATEIVALSIKGVGKLVDSWEKRLGITDPRFESKMVWSAYEISAEDDKHFDRSIDGTYKLFDNCGTANSAFHKRQCDPPLFLFLDPSTCGDVLTDAFVFSLSKRRYAYGETRPIVASLDPKWRQSDRAGVQKTTCTVRGQWVAAPSAKLIPGVSNIQEATFAMPNFLAIPDDQDDCSTALALLVCKVPLNDYVEKTWPKDVWAEVDAIHEREVFESLAWLTERIRTVDSYSEWEHTELTPGWHNCERCAPTPPQLEWKAVGSKIVPLEDTIQAGPYERALKNRPAPWITQLKVENGVGHLRIGLNVLSLCHRALSHLPRDNRTNKPFLTWRMITNYVPPMRIVHPKFKLSSNKHDRMHEQPEDFLRNLRPEQRRSLSWMMDQELPGAPEFIEQEVSEAYLEHMGWLAEAHATQNHQVRGGVLADEVGYGKTAITLGLIACSQENIPEPENTFGLIPVKASLIVVPPHLTNQWTAEVKKFTGNKFKVLKIQNLANLNGFTIKDIMNADIIIVASTLFQSDKYLENLAGFAGTSDCPSTEGRRYNAWMKKTLGSLAEQVEVLKTEGAKVAYANIINASKSHAADAIKAFVPSKRLKGKAYHDAQKKRKRGNETDGSEDESVSDSPRPAKKAKGAADSKSRAQADHWKLGSTAVRSNWTMMKSPPLDIFHFNRLVVDEFTYLKGVIHTGITSLRSTFRWVLSGTPPLGNFADVKTIAVFLGVHLGIDEVSGGKADKKIMKEYTAVEKFRSFGEKRTPSWHISRHQIAQKFLDQFLRQNVAEIDEIPWKEHILPITLPAAERAIYLELEHHLQALDMMIKKGKLKTESDRERRLAESLGDSATAEEALLKRCSHFDLEIDADNKSASKACEVIVEERTKQLEECKEDIYVRLREGFSMMKQIGPRPKGEEHSFERFIRVSTDEGIEDEDATVILLELIRDAKANWMKPKSKAKAASKVSKGKGKGRAKSESLSDDEDEQEEKPKSNQRAKGKGKGKADPDNEDNVGEVISTTADTASLLREKTHAFTRLRKELIGRVRSLRYFKVVRDLQQARLKDAHDDDPIDAICPACNKHLARDTAAVLSSCGHVGCYNCLKMSADKNVCPSRGCKAQPRPTNVVKALTLGVEDTARMGRHYGIKLEEMINLVQKTIPKDEKVLIFVQFQDLMVKVSQALEAHGVKHVQIKGSAAKKSTALTQFQNSEGLTGDKVLLLNVMDESASGANLTNANHAIFLSPLLANTQYEYESCETQAIGRVRRYGQQKTVNIWRFLTKNSIDVEIFEERTERDLTAEMGF